ncbi:MAG: 3-phosphoshikimate 1-carboxyvinyltransferase [Coriobacteriia bacterium]
MTEVFGPRSQALLGRVLVPGDKSLSHRAVLFSAMAEGTTSVSGILDSADVRSTVDAVAALGARVGLKRAEDGSLEGTIEGWGAAGPKGSQTIDCGNSGTTARLLMGVLAGWPIAVTLTGDASLSKRPMRRVTRPLEEMGARFGLNTQTWTLPLEIRGAEHLSPLTYTSSVASAQVKSAILLAGLRANGCTQVCEPAQSRDHTERLLPAFGVAVEVDSARHLASVCGPARLGSAGRIAVPRDPSSAAFLIAAALLVPGSRVELPGVSINETRTGFLRVLQRMGGRIEISLEADAGNEPIGTITASYTPKLGATVVTPEEVPSLIDEVPILALVASQAEGVSRFQGIGELRVKESDRLSAIVQGLRALGAKASAEGETLVVSGPSPLRGDALDSLGDHRLAMTWAVAGLIADQPVEVLRYEAVEVSYPRFAEDLARLQAG